MKKHSFLPSSVHTDLFRIAALALSHGLADMMGGILPGILPAALIYFNMDLGYGVIMLSVVSIAANLLQIPASLPGRKSRRPLWLMGGLVLSSGVLLLSFFPRSTTLSELCCLTALVGFGIAVVHPNGLRGVRNIHSVSSTVTTSVFMTFGFFGASVGPWLSSLLVGRFGMHGLAWLLIPVFFALILIVVSHVRLLPDHSSQETRRKVSSSASVPESPWTIEIILLISFFINTGTTILTSLLPTQLSRAGFDLWFGGFANMLFGFGSAAGSLFLGFYCRKHPSAPLVLRLMALGLPVGMIYLLFCTSSAWWCVLLPVMGCLLTAFFPVLVSFAAVAPGRFSTSLRMALTVGGTWGMAGVVLLIAGQIADRVGISPVMFSVLFFYLCALFTAAVFRRRSA